MFRPQYKDILDVVGMVLCLSPASAEVERAFSQLKLIKTEEELREVYHPKQTGSALPNIRDNRL